MKSLFISGLLVGLLVLSGCGSSSSTKTPTVSPTASAPTTAPAPSSGGALKLAADPSGALKFNTSSLDANTGKVTIDFSNSSPVAHNVTIASPNGAVVGATPTFQGGSKSLAVTLKPGTYTFYCSVPGHRQAGMHGTLVVK